MHRSILCALGCLSTPAVSAPKPKPPITTLAVVEVIQRFDESSGLGGEHYVLRIHDGRKPPRLAHAGGHGVYLGLLGSHSLAKTRPQSTFYVAELAELESPVLGNPGWFADQLPAFDASARRLVRAKSQADAEQLRARLATTGLREPTPTSGTTVIDPPK